MKRGLVANAGGLVRLARQHPYRVALQLVLTGDTISVQELLLYGLINRAAPVGQALAVARELAAVIARARST